MGKHLMGLWFGTIPVGLLLSTMVWADHPSIGFGVEGNGPINTISALPLQAKKWAFGLRMERLNLAPFSDHELEAHEGKDVHSVDALTSTSMGLAYGVSDDFMLSARLAYIARSNLRNSPDDDGHGGGDFHGESGGSDVQGLADALFLGHYRFMQRGNMNYTALFGLKGPTGDDDIEDNGTRYDAEFQPGSGSWDVLLGGAMSYGFGSKSIDANVLYSRNGEDSEGANVADALSFNLAYSFRLKGESDEHEHEGHDNLDGSIGDVHQHIFWDAMFELNGSWRNGQASTNSGGTLLFLAPGVRVSGTKGWGVFLSLGIPVLQDLNGVQVDTDMKINAGFSMVLGS